MGDLNSMAYMTATPSSNPLGFDHHHHLQASLGLGVFNADMSLVMDGYGSTAAVPFFSSSSSPSSPLESSDLSTGYLEDALVEFGAKRRRLMMYNDHDHEGSTDHLIKSYWNSNCSWGLSENFSYLSQISSINGISSDELGSTSSVSMMSQNANIFSDIKTPEEAIFSDIDVGDHHQDSANSIKSVAVSDIFSRDCCPTSDGDGDGDDDITKRIKTRVAYPFAVVKPGGVEGDVTLNDINERILMRPRRPVRHPVGDFACRPCVSPDGPGISGEDCGGLD